MSKPEEKKTGRFSQGLHGGEIYRAASSIGLKPGQILDFSSNTNIFARALTAQILSAASEAWLHYPEADASSIRKSVARQEGVSADCVAPGNGSADLIWRFLNEIAPRSILFIGPVFSEYIRAAEALGIRYNIVTPQAGDEFAVGEPELKKIWESQAELCVICTPNNPGGICYENIGAIFAALRAPRVLVDLSYREFLHGSPSYGANHWNSYSRMRAPGMSIFCLHSFTKFFCCPGLRLGYLVGDSIHIKSINAHMPSWAVSGQAQEAGLRFLDSFSDYQKTLAPMRAAKYELGAELRRLEVFNPDLVLEGPNFFCCGLAENSPGALLSRDGSPLRAAGLQNFLLQHKILVRDCDNIPGMPPGFVRIQVREDADNAKLLHALGKA